MNPPGFDTLSPNEHSQKTRFLLPRSKPNKILSYFCLHEHMWRWNNNRSYEGRKRGEWESIQFNNKDVHLNKRINEAKNLMKCDAFTAHCRLRKDFCRFTPRREKSLCFGRKIIGVLYGVTQHNHKFLNRGFVCGKCPFLDDDAALLLFNITLIKILVVLRRTTFFGFPKTLTHTNSKKRLGKDTTFDKKT